jgi:hypothetical protein
MGAYGHSRIRSFVIGSTTTEMVRSCKVPVLMVGPVNDGIADLPDRCALGMHRPMDHFPTTIPSPQRNSGS